MSVVPVSGPFSSSESYIYPAAVVVMLVVVSVVVIVCSERKNLVTTTMPENVPHGRSGQVCAGGEA